MKQKTSEEVIGYSVLTCVLILMLSILILLIKYAYINLRNDRFLSNLYLVRAIVTSFGHIVTSWLSIERTVDELLLTELLLEYASGNGWDVRFLWRY